LHLFNYCPEKLKIVIISQKPLPSDFLPFFLKQELVEINQKDLLLTGEEAENLLKSTGHNNQELISELLKISQHCISLYIFLAQTFKSQDSLANYQENFLFRNALE